ncbi:MAG TPA: PDZ domain-containing protein, partial [Thermoanaerobaculia bacterium]
MSRALKIFSAFAAVAITAATIGLCLLSFSRRVDHFARAGFEARRAGGAILLTTVDRESAAARAGLAPGDRIITADGQTAASLADPDRSLARKPFPHRLLVERGNEIREVLIGKVVPRPDWPYIFLAFVGLLYLSIGLFTASRDRSEAARVFCAICVASFAIYVLTPTPPRDAAWKSFLLAEDFFRAALPALLLHFFLIFPRRSAGRRFLPLLYAPGIVY